MAWGNDNNEGKRERTSGPSGWGGCWDKPTRTGQEKPKSVDDTLPEDPIATEDPLKPQQGQEQPYAKPDRDNGHDYKG